MTNRQLSIIALLAVIILSTLLVLRYTLFYPVVNAPTGMILDVPQGTSKKAFVKELKNLKVIKYDLVFSLYIHFKSDKKIKAGEYWLSPGSSLFTIWRQITNGTGLYYRPFTIVPGWTFKQIRYVLTQTSALTPTIAKLNDEEVMSKLGAKGISPEGQFYPDTYYYTKGNSDLTILSRAYQLMQKTLNAFWQERETGLPFHTPYEALIAASLVEKEAYLNSERPLIAGVLINRLNKNMLLQFDPTVIYGVGDDYDGKITKEELKTDTPYNTYTRKGLPPTPIAAPSLVSLYATMHPTKHDYYYFVANGDGSHHFSKSLVEHNKAVDNALKLKRARYFNESKIKHAILNRLAYKFDSLGNGYNEKGKVHYN